MDGNDRSDPVIVVGDGADDIPVSALVNRMSSSADATEYASEGSAARVSERAAWHAISSEMCATIGSLRYGSKGVIGSRERPPPLAVHGPEPPLAPV